MACIAISRWWGMRRRCWSGCWARATHAKPSLGSTALLARIEGKGMRDETIG